MSEGHHVHLPGNEWKITRHIQHSTSIGPYYRPTAVQAKRQYLLTLQVNRYCEEQHSALSAQFTNKQKLSFCHLRV